MQIRLSTLLTLGLLSGLTPFAIDMYLPSLPAIAQDLDSTIELAQLSVTAYLGVFALAQLVLGPASDVLGRRATIGAGLALFCLGALICALAGQMETLLLGRAVQGLGGAAVAVTVPALVRDLFERDQYARVMSLVMLILRQDVIRRIGRRYLFPERDVPISRPGKQDGIPAVVLPTPVRGFGPDRLRRAGRERRAWPGLP